MKDLLEGKAIIITGAGRGIGRALAHAVAREGANVIVNDISAHFAERVACEIEGIGGNARPIVASVATWSGAASIVSACVSSYGHVDGAVLNAGVMPWGPPWNDEEESLRSVVDVNLLGAMYCGVHLLKQMMGQGYGSIVNITSGAQMGRPGLAAYGATKGGIASLTYGWALDCAIYGIRVNAVWPSAETSLGTAYIEDYGGGGARAKFPPEANSGAVLYLLSDLSRKVTGQVIAIRGNQLGVVRHPKVEGSMATTDGFWETEAVAREFDGQLHNYLQELGAPPDV